VDQRFSHIAEELLARIVRQALSDLLKEAPLLSVKRSWTAHLTKKHDRSNVRNGSKADATLMSATRGKQTC
jgi:hypothetical protein